MAPISRSWREDLLSLIERMFDSPENYIDIVVTDEVFWANGLDLGYEVLHTFSKEYDLTLERLETPLVPVYLKTIYRLEATGGLPSPKYDLFSELYSRLYSPPGSIDTSVEVNFAFFPVLIDTPLFSRDVEVMLLESRDKLHKMLYSKQFGKYLIYTIPYVLSKADKGSWKALLSWRPEEHMATRNSWLAKRLGGLLRELPRTLGVSG